jgi:glutathione S-transferase
MKLHWSGRSPFVRKVMVAAHELGLVDRLTLIRSVVAMSAPNKELMRDNPLSRIPTLVLDDGTVLTDSLLICEYLQMQAGGHLLFPADPKNRIDALRRHALGTGFIEVSVLRRNELNRAPGQRSPAYVEAFAAKFAATLPAFEREAPVLSAKPIDIGHIAIGCALSYLDFRFADEPWRPAFPAIALWHQKFDMRPSMLATVPIDG